MVISRSYKATKSADGNYYLYLTVKKGKSKDDRTDKYIGKLPITDERIKIILDKKESSEKLKTLALADSKRLGME